MSLESIRNERRVARRSYPCGAAEFVIDALNNHPNPFTFSELRIIAKAKKNNWRIQEGEQYVYQFNKFSGETYTFRANKELHALCVEHELYG